MRTRNSMKSVIAQGATIAKAIEEALKKADMPQEFFVKLLEDAQAGFLGFGGRKAKIALFFKKEVAVTKGDPVLSQESYDQLFDNPELQKQIDNQQRLDQQKPSQPIEKSSHSTNQQNQPKNIQPNQVKPLNQAHPKQQANPQRNPQQSQPKAIHPNQVKQPNQSQPKPAVNQRQQHTHQSAQQSNQPQSKPVVNQQQRQVNQSAQPSNQPRQQSIPSKPQNDQQNQNQNSTQPNVAKVVQPQVNIPQRIVEIVQRPLPGLQDPEQKKPRYSNRRRWFGDEKKNMDQGPAVDKQPKNNDSNNSK